MNNSARVAKPLTKKEKGEAYKAHWDANWKATADQSRARKIVEAAKAKAAAAKATPPVKPQVKSSNSATARRRGKGYGGGQFA
jgi:hypothetical protein